MHHQSRPGGLLTAICVFVRVQGMQYFISRGLVDDDPAEIAMFLHTSSQMDPLQMRRYLDQQSVLATVRLRSNLTIIQRWGISLAF